MRKRWILLLALICAIVVLLGPVRIGLLLLIPVIFILRIAPYLIAIALILWFLRRRRRRF